MTNTKTVKAKPESYKTKPESSTTVNEPEHRYVIDRYGCLISYSRYIQNPAEYAGYER